jgi:hypothetical protein
MPTPGNAAAVSALYTATKPTDAPSPYHAFAHCPPTALFGKCVNALIGIGIGGHCLMCPSGHI